ncbi:MAG: cytochrome d ubiquinol oxidase subunit II [Myxococcota bacterium]|jgi:cytochrome d ubiquinol oxidase subunit II
MLPEPLVAALIGGVLVAYVLLGGADFGGGVWDLFAAWSPRKVRQRRAIALNIGPIWEANHVWLIVVIVVMFVAFPVAFASVSTALHIPLVLMLIGVVLRGTSFVFRTYDSRRESVQAGWSWVFAGASTVTPVLLGVTVGAVASGRIRHVDGVLQADFFSAWLAPFPWAVGLLTTAIFAYLAAVYLAVDTAYDPELQEDFRARGLWASAAVFVLAWVAFGLSRSGAPQVWAGLWESAWSVPFQLVVGGVGLACIGTLWSRRYALARALVVVQVVLVVGGWACAQYPFIIPPDLTVYDAAGPDRVQWMLLAVLGLGSIPLVPTYAWMLWVFKGQRPLRSLTREEGAATAATPGTATREP